VFVGFHFSQNNKTVVVPSRISKLFHLHCHVYFSASYGRALKCILVVCLSLLSLCLWMLGYSRHVLRAELEFFLIYTSLMFCVLTLISKILWQWFACSSNQSMFWWLSCNQNTDDLNITQFQLAHVIFYMYITHVLTDVLDNNACSMCTKHCHFEWIVTNWLLIV
jgi:hypothetical protein